MRIPMIPGVLILVLGGLLLYAAFHVNREVLVVTDERPKLAFATATDLAVNLEAGAVRYRQQLGRWPKTPADVNLDEKWMSAHRGIESLSYGTDGSVHVHLNAAIDGPATWIVWTPREHGERVIWDCASDHPDIPRILKGCVTAEASLLAMSELESAGGDMYVDVAGLDERCQALGKVGYAATKARDEGDPIEVFIRRPVVAFVDDQKRRAELEDLARWVYASPARSPSATQREVLTQYRCKAT